MPRWPQKPPLGARIDWTHPLTRGMRILLAMNECAGPAAGDIAAGDKFSLSGGAAWQTGNIAGGVGVFSSGAAQYSQGTKLLNLPKVTIAVKVTLTAFSSSSWIAGFEDGNGASTYDKALIISGAGNFLFYAFDGAQKIASNGGTASLQKQYTVVGVADGTNLYCWVNGVPSAPAACGNTFTGYSVAGNVILGGQPANTYSACDKMIDYFGLWDRAISPDEVRALTADPYAMIVAPSTRRFFFSASVASYAWWAQQRGGMLGQGAAA